MILYGVGGLCRAMGVDAVVNFEKQLLNSGETEGTGQGGTCWAGGTPSRAPPAAGWFHGFGHSAVFAPCLGASCEAAQLLALV